MQSGTVLDGVVAQDAAQFASLWALRELIPESCSKSGAAYKYDLSIPVGEMYNVVEEMRTHLEASGMGDSIRGVAGFGHMGDGECNGCACNG
jgi:FAD/FMN-containing dehydrogenase